MHKPLVVAMDGHCQHLFGVFLADDVLIELGDDLPRCKHFVEKRLAGASSPAFLFKDGLAKIDAFAANVDVARPLYQGSDVAIAFATEGAESVFFGGACSTTPAIEVTS